MNEFDEAMNALITPEVLYKLKQIEKLDDPLEQGYQSAPILAESAGMGPRELARRIISAATVNDHGINHVRDLGVIRWCLERIEEA